MIEFGHTSALLLTPPGTGAIGVVRVVGPEAPAIVAELFHPASRGIEPARTSAQAPACGSLPDGERLAYGLLVIDDEVVDDVVVSRSTAGALPAVDICAHGGVRVVERILEALARRDAPLCEAGESRPPIWPVRNLIEDDAASVMASAKTARAVRFLAWQRRHLPEELSRAASFCRTDAARAQRVLVAAMERFDAAWTLIDGATVAIVGPPNTGKSTLFNALIGRSVTIVSSHTGTTRDWVDESVEMDGIPVRLVDTAGWQDETSQLESRAIASGLAISEQADVCLLVLDGSQLPSQESQELLRASRSFRRTLVLLNKADLGCVSSGLPSARAGSPDNAVVLRVSALTGSGLDQLAHEILRLLGFADWVDTAPTFFTPRQRDIGARVLSDLPLRPQTAEVRIETGLIGVVGGGRA